MLRQLQHSIKTSNPQARHLPLLLLLLLLLVVNLHDGFMIEEHEFLELRTGLPEPCGGLQEQYLIHPLHVRLAQLAPR